MVEIIYKIKEGGLFKVLGELVVNILINIIDVGFDVYYVKLVELVGILGGVWKVVDIGINVV